MTPVNRDEKSKRRRLEDSFSLPENQRKYPDDPYANEHEKEVLEKLHLKNFEEERGKLPKN